MQKLFVFDLEIPKNGAVFFAQRQMGGLVQRFSDVVQDACPPGKRRIGAPFFRQGLRRLAASDDVISAFFLVQRERTFAQFFIGQIFHGKIRAVQAVLPDDIQDLRRQIAFCAVELEHPADQRGGHLLVFVLHTLHPRAVTLAQQLGLGPDFGLVLFRRFLP